MTAILLEMLESLSLQWPIALTFMSFPIGLSIWLIRHRSGRWSSNSLILSGLAVMIVGLSRPMMQGIEPTPLDQVILVIDSSASMRASDVLPSRIDLAKQIANAFIEALPAHASLGLISMAANASVIQTPTRQRHQLEQALERISLQPGSALGSAIILATAQAIPEAAIDVERLITGSSRRSMVSSSSLSNASEAGSGSKAFKQPESPASPVAEKAQSSFCLPMATAIWDLPRSRWPRLRVFGDCAFTASALAPETVLCYKAMALRPGFDSKTKH